MNNNEKRIEILFDELVPSMGKCDSVAGEMVRAVSRVVYRFWNDGDKIGVDYGNETCNAPARYLEHYGNVEISTLINDMWGMYDDDDIYKICCDKLCGLVADQIENDPSLRKKETEDMLDYFRQDDYDYSEYEEYEEYEEDEEDEEEED